MDFEEREKVSVTEDTATTNDNKDTKKNGVQYKSDIISADEANKKKNKQSKDDKSTNSSNSEKTDNADTTDNKSKNKPKTYGRRTAIDMKKILTIIMCVIMFFMLMTAMTRASMPDKTNTKWPELLEKIEAGEIDEVTIYQSTNVIDARTKTGELLTVPNPRHDTYRQELMMTGVQVNVATKSFYDAVQDMITEIPLFALLAILGYYFISSIGTVTRSYMQTATMQDGVPFNRVAGMSEVKEELQFAIEFLKKPSAYRDCGARVPKGMLMVGPPGTGKTLLAKAVAGEAGVPFIHTTGSDFSEMFAGLGAKRVRELFAFAKTNSPCVVFIDELDSVGARRTGQGDSVSRDNNQTLNALLKEMDGIGSTYGIFVMGATNTPEHLDNALMRPGRFDRQVYVGPPKRKEDRIAIIDVHLHGKFVEEGVTPETISRKMVGFTGAEIEVVLNEAVINSLMHNREGVISMDDIDTAIERLITKGLRSKVVKNDELKRIAIHESGHALIGLLCGRRIAKVTVVPSTSGVGGFTMPDAEQYEDKLLKTEEELKENIIMLYGGLCAEELLLNSHSTGCSNDIQKATQEILQFVSKFAMGGTSIDISEIDKERLAKIASEQGQELKTSALSMLTNNKELLIKLWTNLYINETMSFDSIDDVNKLEVIDVDRVEVVK